MKNYNSNYPVSLIEAGITIKGNKYNELENVELSDNDIKRLKLYEQTTFIDDLTKAKDKETAILFLRTNMTMYVANGGSPNEWLEHTINLIGKNYLLQHISFIHTIKEWLLKENDFYKLNQQQVKPKKINKLTFKDLFKDPDNAKKVKEILENNHYTNGGKWAANKDLYMHHTGNKTELLTVYYILRNKEILKQGKPTPQAKIFYKEFGLKVGDYISDRSLRNEPPPYRQKVFEKLFYSIK